MKIGAHVTIEKGYVFALEKLAKMGGNCLQIFSTTPRGWRSASLSQTQINNFLAKKKEYEIGPVFYHASYLINLGDFGSIGHLSKQSLEEELNLASQTGINGSIIHLGSFKLNAPDYQKLADNINAVLEKTPPNTLFIIENAGNKKIGNTLEEIGQIIKLVKNSRVKVCLDTCHLFSAGYDISSKAKLDSLLKEFDKKIGLEKLEVWHVNDSRDPFGSFRDRHENIGQGTLGLGAFETLLNHPQTKDYLFIAETPGFDGLGPDKENIDILKGLVKKS